MGEVMRGSDIAQRREEVELHTIIKDTLLKGNGVCQRIRCGSDTALDGDHSRLHVLQHHLSAPQQEVGLQEQQEGPVVAPSRK
jgi:hypothetical protein